MDIGLLLNSGNPSSSVDSIKSESHHNSVTSTSNSYNTSASQANSGLMASSSSTNHYNNGSLPPIHFSPQLPNGGSAYQHQQQQQILLQQLQQQMISKPSATSPSNQSPYKSGYQSSSPQQQQQQQQSSSSSSSFFVQNNNSNNNNNNNNYPSPTHAGRSPSSQQEYINKREGNESPVSNSPPMNSANGSPKQKSKQFIFSQYQPSPNLSGNNTPKTNSLTPNNNIFNTNIINNQQPQSMTKIAVIPPLQLSQPSSPLPHSPPNSGKISPQLHHSSNSLPNTGRSLNTSGSNNQSLRLSTNSTHDLSSPPLSPNEGNKEFNTGSRSPTSATAEKEKKRRTRLKKDQASTLKSFFEKDNYPNKEEKEKLASMLGMNYTAVTTWFSNKRQEKRRKVADGTGGRRVPIDEKGGDLRLSGSNNDIRNDLHIDDDDDSDSNNNGHHINRTPGGGNTPSQHTSLTPIISGIGLHSHGRPSPMMESILLSQSSPLLSPHSASSTPPVSGRGGYHANGNSNAAESLASAANSLSILSQVAKGDIEGMNGPTSPFSLNSQLANLVNNHHHSSPISSPRSPLSTHSYSANNNSSNNKSSSSSSQLNNNIISDSDEDYFDDSDEMIEYLSGESDFEEGDFPEGKRRGSVSGSNKSSLLEIASRKHRHMKNKSRSHHSRHNSSNSNNNSPSMTGKRKADISDITDSNNTFEPLLTITSPSSVTSPTSTSSSPMNLVLQQAAATLSSGMSESEFLSSEVNKLRKKYQ